MKKKILFSVLLLMFSVWAEAQILIVDDEFEGTLRQEETDWTLIEPYEGGDIDEYLPIGNGLLALTGLAGAYLIAKRKKKR